MLPQLLATAAQALLNRPLGQKGKEAIQKVTPMLQQQIDKAKLAARPIQGPKKPSPEQIMGADESTLDKMLSSFFPKASADEYSDVFDNPSPVVDDEYSKVFAPDPGEVAKEKSLFSKGLSKFGSAFEDNIGAGETLNRGLEGLMKIGGGAIEKTADFLINDLKIPFTNITPGQVLKTGTEVVGGGLEKASKVLDTPLKVIIGNENLQKLRGKADSALVLTF